MVISYVLSAIYHTVQQYSVSGIVLCYIYIYIYIYISATNFTYILLTGIGQYSTIHCNVYADIHQFIRRNAYPCVNIQ